MHLAPIFLPFSLKETTKTCINIDAACVIEATHALSCPLREIQNPKFCMYCHPTFLYRFFTFFLKQLFGFVLFLKFI